MSSTSKRYGATAVALLALLLLSACSSAKTSPIVAGKAGSQLKIAWVREHRRPLFQNANEDAWSRVNVAVDRGGNVYLLDRLTGHGNRRGWWLRKFKPNGGVAWTVKQAPKPGQKLLSQRVAIGPTGEIYVVSVARQKHRGVYLTKLTSTGRRLWEARRDLQPKLTTGMGFMLTVDKQGDAYVGGTVIHSGYRQPWLAKFSKDGKFTWEKFPVKPGITGDARSLRVAHGMIAIKYNQWRPSGREPFTDDIFYYDAGGRELAPTEAGPKMDDRSHAYGARTVDASEPIPSWWNEQERFLWATGPREFVYRVPLFEPEQLDIWLEVQRGDYASLGLRAALLHANDKPSAQSIEPKQLVVDSRGSAYVTITEKRLKYNLVKLYKVEVKLPEVSAKVRTAAAQAAKIKIPPLAPAVAQSIGRVDDADMRRYLTKILPLVRIVDKDNQRPIAAAEALAGGDDAKAMSLLFYGQRMRQEYLYFQSTLYPLPLWMAPSPPAAARFLGKLREVAETREKAGDTLDSAATSLDPAGVNKAAAELRRVVRLTTEVLKELQRLHE